MRAVTLFALVLAGALSFTSSARAGCIEYADYLHQDGGLPIHYGPQDVVFSGAIVYAACEDSLRMIDISDPESPVTLSAVGARVGMEGVALSGHYAYVTDVFTLDVIDITDPAHPQIVRAVNAPARIFKIVISGSYAYILGASTDPFAFLTVFDLSIPGDPRLVTTLSIPGAESWGGGLGISGAYLYLAMQYADHSELQVVSIANPRNPVVVKRMTMPDVAVDLAVDDYFAYIATNAAGLLVVSITDPLDPRVVGSVLTPPAAADVAVVGGTAFVAASTGGFLAVDVSRPQSPTAIGSIHGADYATFAAASGGIACYGLGSGAPLRLQFVDISNPHMPGIVGSVDTPSTAQDVAVWGSYAYVADTDHLQVVDITSPGTPRIVGSTTAQAKRVVLSNGYACAAGDYVLQVIDIGNPQNPQIIGNVPTGFVMGMAASGRYVYIAAESDGLQVVDIVDPRHPVVVNTLPLNFMCTGMDLAGARAYVVGSRQMVAIDISDPTSPRLLGALDLGRYPPNDVAVSGDYAFIADGWYNVFVADVHDAANMSVVGSVTTGDYSIGKNITISGNYAYVTDGGIEVIDISNPLGVRLVGCAGLLPDGSRDVSVRNGYCYVADGAAGLQILPVQCDPQSGVAEDRDTATRGITLSVRPNPAFRCAMIRLEMPAEGAVRATIHDVTGRLVRTFPSGIMSPGSHDLLWDGRDDRGHSVAPGVYVVRVSTSEGTKTGRVVISK